MPDYDYRCKKCGAKYQVTEKMSEHKAEIPCWKPDCDGIMEQTWEDGRAPMWSWR